MDLKKQIKKLESFGYMALKINPNGQKQRMTISESLAEITGEDGRCNAYCYLCGRGKKP